jgi:hypothetical protein
MLLLGLAFPAWAWPQGADIPFDHVILDREGPKDPWAKIAGDINGDAFPDVVIGGRQGPLVWYAYPTWPKAVIADGGYKTVDGELGDIDGDGDLDVVMGGLIWYENPRPGGDPAKRIWRTHKIADHPTHDIELADLDGDGDVDIVTRDQSEFGHKAGNRIHLWRQDSGDKWTEKVINCPHGEAIALGDMDKDGDPDIVIGGIWFENNQDVVNGPWSAHRFGDWHPSATVQVADINGDSRPDVVLSPSELKGQSYKMSWFEAPSDPKKDNWPEHVIVEPIECVIHGLVTADINGDGMIDVVSSEMHQGANPDEVAVFINRKNGSSWKKQIVSSKGSHYIRVADIGNDGDMDIVGANWSGPYQPIEMWENKSGGWVHLSSRRGDLPSADVGRQAASLILDIDKDGVNDFVIAGWSGETSMVWFRRTAEGWERYLVDNRKSHIEAGGTYWDIDDDGDLDILQGGSWATNEVWWWENPHPNYDPDTPWNRHTIKDSGQKQHHDQIFGDFDGDGRAELVFWNQRAQKLLIADIPEEPKKKENWSFTEVWSWPRVFKYEGFAKGDIDLDGKTDLVGGGYWFKHIDGTTYTANQIDDYGMSRSAVGDLIKGGRPEIVLGSGDGVAPLNLYCWQDSRWEKHTLIKKVDHGHTLQVEDIDGDGNLDIYAAEMYDPGPGQKCKQFVLYGDGRGNFDTEVISVGIGTHEGRLGDLDGDGDTDILQKDFQKEQRVDVWLNRGTYQPNGVWWDETFKYRLPVRVGAGGIERINKPAEVDVDLTAELKRLHVSDPANEGSVRVVEVASDGKVIDDSVVFQFDEALQHDARAGASGKLTFMLKGMTPAAGTRIFQVYFGGPSDLPATELEGLVACTDDVQHEGQDSIKIVTNNVTYYYHRKGAAFASLEDTDGNDWLGYNPGVGPISRSGSGGKYRGLPNMGHPEGYCHPGNTVSSSRIVSKGPIRIAIASESNDGKMKCRWDIFPDYARLTILKMRTPYWFLYEGTPGGKLEINSDVCVRPIEPGGLRTTASLKWDGDVVNLYGPVEWLYFADLGLNRSLFLIHHEDDEAVDSYWPMNEEMTVFGFGRKGLNKFMRTVPTQFTIGLCDERSFVKVSKVVDSVYRDLVIHIGPVQTQSDVESLSACNVRKVISDNYSYR